MSIGPIETNPLGDDDVTVVDPGDVTVEPSYGHSTKPWDLRSEQATGHADPDAENITHVPGTSKSREIDLMDAFDLDIRTLEHGKGADPDAAFTTGTDTRPERYIHDEALQVRQLLPTQFAVAQYVFPIGNQGPFLIAPFRPERTRIVLNITGGDDGFIFLAPTRQQAIAGSGFILPSHSSTVSTANGPFELFTSSELWVSSNDTSIILSVLEEFRTEVDAQ